MAVTLAQIAARLGVSEATVSRVLNGRATALISKATADRVFAVAAELGYKPSRLFRGGSTGRTGVVALWIRRPDAPYYARMVHCVQRCAAEDGFEMILRGYRDEASPAALPGGRDRGLNWGGSMWPIDGLICADCRLLAESYLASARSPGGRTRIPVVGIGNDYPEEIDSVGFDVEHGAAEAVRHLVAMGRRRVVHVTAETSIGVVREGRAAAYRRVARESGIEPRVVTADDESRAAARRAVLDDIRRHGPPDGVFCLNDEIAVGAYRALRDLDLRIPDDVALVGCDDIDEVSYLDVPLTTIRQPTEELCRVAWRALRRRMAEPDAPLVRERITPQLVVRQSSRHMDRDERVPETVVPSRGPTQTADSTPKPA